MRLAFRERPIDLFAVAGATVLAVVAIAAPGTGAFRFALGILLVLFLPGYAIGAAVFPRAGEVDWIERIALSFGISLATVPLLGLALNATPIGVRLEPAVVSILLVTLGMTVYAYERRIAVPPRERLALVIELDAPKWRALPTIDKALAIGAAIALVLGGIAWSVSTVPPTAGFTEFYLLDETGGIASYRRTLNASQEGLVIVGIWNHEHREMNYTVEVWLLHVAYVYNDTTRRNDTIVLDSAVIDRFPANLTDGGRSEAAYPFSIPNPGDYLLRFLLFIPSRATPYRLVQLEARVV